MTPEKVTDVLSRGLGLLVIIILAFVADYLVRRALRRAAERVRHRAAPKLGPRAVTLIELSASIAKYAIFFVAAFMVLMQVGIPVAPILVSAGIVGLAVGFGAQSLVRDVVSGFFILLEGQYNVGDIVEINGITGEVEEVGLRLTRLRDARSQVYFFPNGAITSVDVFPLQGQRFQVHVPAAEGQAIRTREAAYNLLIDFNTEYRAFVGTPTQVGMKELSSYATVLLFEVTFIPLRQTVALEKLSARLSAGLARAGVPLPQGAEVAILPVLPEGLPQEIQETVR